MLFSYVGKQSFVFSVTLVSGNITVAARPLCAFPWTANYPPLNFLTDNGTIKTLSLNNRFAGHWGLMTAGVKKQMNPLQQNYPQQLGH